MEANPLLFLSAPTVTLQVRHNYFVVELFCSHSQINSLQLCPSSHLILLTKKKGVFVKSALRVVQVDLEMSQLLPSMIRQASRVISRIVEMTNAAYSLALPNYEDAQAEAIRHNLPASPANQKGNVHPEDHPEQGSSLHIISPSLKPVKESTSTTDSDPPVVPDLTLGDESTLSTEKCEHLVDYIFGEINDSFMRPPSSKKAKFSSGVDALPVGS